MKLVTSFILISITLFILLTGFCSCTKTQITEFELPQRRYIIYNPQELQTITPTPKWMVDKNGKTIPIGEQFTIIHDFITKEPQCLTLKKVEDNKEKNGHIELSALFDLEGNLIEDWDYVNYLSGFGDVVIKQDSLIMAMKGFEITENEYQSSLWNFRTKETYIENVYSIEHFEKDNSFLIKDYADKALGVIDRTGEIVSNVPIADDYYDSWVWNDYIIATKEEPFLENQTRPNVKILSKNFEILFSIPHQIGHFRNFYEKGFNNNYLIMDYHEAGVDYTSIIQPETWNTLFTVSKPDDITYFDGELIIIKSESENTEYYCLTKSNGNIIQDGFNLLTSATVYSSKEPASMFIGIKDNSVILLSRDGTIIGQTNLHGISNIQYLESDLYVCHKGTEDLLLLSGNNLKIIIEPGIYQSINRGFDYQENTLFDFLVCTKYLGYNDYSYDIIDFKGNIIIQGISNIFDIGQNRLSVTKGSDKGLMEWNGNWIVKKPISYDSKNDCGEKISICNNQAALPPCIK